MSTKKADTKTAETRAAPIYTKEALMKAKIFAGRSDALGALVRDREILSVEDAQARIDKFMKRKVK